MLKAGWCPSAIKRLNATLDPASFFLCSRFKPPATEEGKMHLDCKVRQFLVLNCMIQHTALPMFVHLATAKRRW
jgi:hypothetical protein